MIVRKTPTHEQCRPLIGNYVGQTFTGSISVDGNRYINCTFEECVIVYGGGAPPSFSGCHFKNSRWCHSWLEDAALPRF